VQGAAVVDVLRGVSLFERLTDKQMREVPEGDPEELAPAGEVDEHLCVIPEGAAGQGRSGG